MALALAVGHKTQQRPAWIVLFFLFYERNTNERKRVIGRIGKGISAQALHKTVLEILTSHGFSHSS